MRSVEEWRTMSPRGHVVVACRYFRALALSLWKTIVDLGKLFLFWMCVCACVWGGDEKFIYYENQI